MSQENVELVYQSSDAFIRRDLDAFLAFNDPDVEFTPRILGVEGGGPYRGHDGIRSWWENLLAALPDFGGEIAEVRDLGDVTVARARLRGHGAESAAPIELTAWQVVEWRDKKAIWWGFFRSEAEALKAAGLRE
jgi:ketosteroid isomerase-like protein